MNSVVQRELAKLAESSENAIKSSISQRNLDGKIENRGKSIEKRIELRKMRKE